MPDNLNLGAATQTRFNGITNSREKLVKKCITSVINGNLTLNQALKNAKKEGPIALLSEVINKLDKSEKHQNVEKVFMQELSKQKLRLARGKFQELITSQNIRATNTDFVTEPHRANLWGMFSALSIEDSSGIKITTSFTLSDSNQQLKLITKIENKDAISSEVETIGMTKEVAKVILEYHLFQKWHQDIDIPKHEDLQLGAHLSKKTYDEIVNNFNNKILPRRNLDSLILPSGGAKGVMIPGCITALGNHAIKNIKSVAGASVGSLIASTIACGAKPHEVEEISAKLEVLNIIARRSQRDANHDKLINMLNIENVKIIKKRLQEFGTDQIINNKIATIEDIAERNALKSFYQQISNNESEYKISFSELSLLKKHFPNAGFKDLYVPVTLIPENIELELSARTVPNLSIATAIKASSALPHVFSAVDLNESLAAGADIRKLLQNKGISRQEGSAILVSDGGILNAVPVNFAFRGGEQSSPKFLTMSFNDIADKKLSVKERVKQAICKSSVYTDKRVIIKFLKVHYPESLQLINLPKYDIQTTDFKKAARQFFQISHEQEQEFTLKYIFNNGKDTHTSIKKFPDEGVMSKLKNIEYEYHNSSSWKRKLGLAPDQESINSIQNQEARKNIKTQRDLLYYLAGSNPDLFKILTTI